MKKLQSLIKFISIFEGYWRYLSVYRSFLGNKIFIIFGLSLLAVAADALGIMMILPLLKVSEMAGEGFGEKANLLLTIIKTLGFPQTTTGVLLFMGCVFLVKGCIKFAETAVRGYLQAELLRDLKSRLLTYYLRMEYRFYVSRNTGHFINVINEQTSRFVQSFLAFSQFSAQGVTTLGYLTFAAAISWMFTVMAVVAGLFVMFFFRLLSNFSRKLSMQVSFQGGVLNKFLIEIMQGLKYLASTSSTEYLARGAMKSMRTIAGYEFKQKAAAGLIASVGEPLSVWLLIAIMLIQLIAFHQPVAPIIITVVLFYRAFGSVVSVQAYWQQIMSYIGGLEMTLDEFNQVQKQQESSGRKRVGEFKDRVVFEDVCFAYAKENVLKDINLSIPLNVTIAIVGESGVGKTTLIDLITLLLKPGSGEIFVDNIPHQELDYNNWRKNIGLVTQETIVFDDTIANNISLWTCGYERDETCRYHIEEAARRAYCHSFIQEFSDGYETVVGDRGIKLSGGQRQRLFIARELFKNPKILILDEATSSLDTESERYIQKSIDELKGKMTVVIIAHRLSTIKNVDYIYVLDKGRIIEEGSYEQLLTTKDSRFGRMIMLQLL